MLIDRIRALSSRAQRRLAIALAIGGCLVIAAALAAPAWWLHARYDNETNRLTRQLKSYTALNKQRPELLATVEALKARDTKKYYLKGTTPALAGAELQDHVKATIESGGARMLSAQLLPHKDEPGVRSIHATIVMTANIQALRRVLYALEGREPYLFLDNVSVRSNVPANMKPQPGFEPEMFVQFDVAGLSPVVASAGAAPSGGGNSSPGGGKSADGKLGAKS